MVAAAPVPAWSSNWRPVRIPSERADIRFGLYWQDERVGFHTVSIRPGATAGSGAIQTTVRIQVELVILTLYRLEHDSEELWKDGRLESLVSRSFDDGDAFRVTGSQMASGFEMSGPYGVSVVPGDLPPSNAIWTPDALSWPQMIDSQRGGAMPVRVRDLGRSSVSVRGSARPARGYAFTTPFTKGESWYDANGRWVKMRLLKDGDAIEYRLES